MFDKGGVDDRLAVGVIVARCVARDLGAFSMLAPRREIEVIHSHKNATLRWLQAVAYIRQRTVCDRTHRVREVTVMQFLIDALLDHVADIVGLLLVFARCVGTYLRHS